MKPAAPKAARLLAISGRIPHFKIPRQLVFQQHGLDNLGLQSAQLLAVFAGADASIKEAGRVVVPLVRYAMALARIIRLRRTKVEKPLPELRKSFCWKTHCGPITLALFKLSLGRAGDLLDPAYNAFE